MIIAQCCASVLCSLAFIHTSDSSWNLEYESHRTSAKGGGKLPLTNLYETDGTQYQKWFDYITLFYDQDTTLMAGRHLSYSTVAQAVEPDISVGGHPRFGFERLHYSELQQVNLSNSIFGFNIDKGEILPYVEQRNRVNRFWKHPQFDNPQVYLIMPNSR